MQESFGASEYLVKANQRSGPSCVWPWFYEQALVCLSNKSKSTRADVDHFLAKWRVTVFVSNCFGLIYVSI